MLTRQPIQHDSRMRRFLKNKITKILFVVFLILCLVIFNLIFSKKEEKITSVKVNEVSKETKPKTEEVFAFNNSFINLTKDDLEKDLKQYSNISNRVKKDIIETVLTVANQYKINPLIIYSLLHAESSMNFFIEHTPVVQNINNKQVKTNALGLGGVIWEWHSDDLIREGIAEVKSDLYDPKINIRATAFVYDKMYKLEKIKDAKSQDESAMLRYFGAANKGYFERIDAKIGSMIAEKLYRNNK